MFVQQATQAEVEALKQEEIRLQEVIKGLRKEASDMDPRVMIPPPPIPRNNAFSPKLSPKSSERGVSGEITSEKSDMSESKKAARKLEKLQKDQAKQEIKNAHKERSAGHSLLARCFGSHMKAQGP